MQGRPRTCHVVLTVWDCNWVEKTWHARQLNPAPAISITSSSPRWTLTQTMGQCQPRTLTNATIPSTREIDCTYHPDSSQLLPGSNASGPTRPFSCAIHLSDNTHAQPPQRIRAHGQTAAKAGPHVRRWWYAQLSRLLKFISLIRSPS